MTNKSDIINSIINYFKEESVKDGDPSFFDDALELIQKDLDSFSKYVDSVVNMENAMECARFRMDGDEWRDYIQKLDTNRRIKHEACIAACQRLNRFAMAAGCDELFYDGNENDRYEVQAFAEELVCEKFEIGISKDFDKNIKKSSEANNSEDLSF